jgi:hypothetical protein
MKVYCTYRGVEAPEEGMFKNPCESPFNQVTKNLLWPAFNHAFVTEYIVTWLPSLPSCRQSSL